MSRDFAKRIKQALCLAYLFVALNPCRGDSMDAYMYFRKARKEFDSRQLDAALFDYSKVIELDPANEGAHINRGDIEMRQGNLEGALTDFDKAIELNPNDAIAYHNRGIVDYDKKDMAGALADYSRAIALNPAYAEAYDNRGNVKRTEGDLAGAMADYSKAIDLEPHTALAYSNRGLLEQQQGKLDAALADLNQAVNLDPKNSLFYSKLANLKLATGDRAGAQDDLKKSAEAKSVLTVNDYRLRGRTEAAVHQWDDSLADLNRAKIIDPGDADIFVDLGRYNTSRGDIPGALKDFNQAIFLNSNDAAAYYQRGVAKGVGGDDEGAIADFDKALGLKPKYADVYRARGFVESDLGEDNAAMADVDQAIAIAPQWGFAYNSRGWLRYDRHDFDGALADFLKSCQLDSPRPQGSFQDYSRFCIWLIRSREGHESQATADLQGYLQDRRPRGTNDWSLKIAQYLTGTLSEADLLKAAEEPSPRRNSARHADAWFFVASKHLVEGNEMRAKNCFEKCLATNAKDNVEYIGAVAELKYLAQEQSSRKSSF